MSELLPEPRDGICFAFELVESYRAANRLNQFCRIISDAILENDFHLLDVLDFRGGVAVNHSEVGGFSRGQRANAIVFSEEFRAILRGDMNGLDGSEARFDEQFDFSLVAETGEIAAIAGGVFTGEQHAASLHEIPLELHFVLQKNGPRRILFLADESANSEIRNARIRKHGVQNARFERRAARHIGLKYGHS